MQQIYVESYFIKGLGEFLNYSSILNHPQREIIERRLKIIKFFDEYGQKATKEAFGVARSTVFLWKQKLKQSGGRLESLALKCKAPLRRRERITHPAILKFIKDYRLEHHQVGKETIKPPLDAYCRSLGIKSVSESTVGRIIKDLKERGEISDYQVKITINGRTGNLRFKKQRKGEKKLRRKGYKPQIPGDLVQIDAITIFLDGIKRYIITAIDLKSRFAFGYCYKTLSSYTASDFMQRFQTVAPFAIKRIQTDNGAEFHKYFREYVKRKGIIHFFNYPRRPQLNSYIERFNGLIQSQYISWHLDELLNPEEFNKGLMKYLIWYNTEKQHRNLNKLPPLKYFLNTYIFNPKKSNMLWTLTKTCFIILNSINFN